MLKIDNSDVEMLNKHANIMQVILEDNIYISKRDSFKDSPPHYIVDKRSGSNSVAFRIHAPDMEHVLQAVKDIKSILDRQAQAEEELKMIEREKMDLENSTWDLVHNGA